MAAEEGQTGQTAGTGGSGGGPAPASGVPESVSAAGGSASPPAAPSAAVAGGGEGGAAAQAGAGYIPVHEALAQMGYALPEGLTGQAALQHVMQEARRARELEQLAGYGRQYVQHADQFTAWMRQQEEARKAQEAKSWWRAPEFDPSWASKLTRDPQTGEIRVLPGNDPSIATKYLQAQEHQQSFLNKFAFDPVGAIKPGIEEVARAIAMQVVQQHLGGYSEQAQAEQFVAHHSSWLHQTDAQGRPVIDAASGRPQLSPWGQRFAGYVQAAEAAGLRSVESQQQYALGMVQRDYLLQTYQEQAQGGGAQPPGATGNPANKQFLERNRQQGTPPAGGQAPPPAAKGQTLRQRMASQFKANGMNMADEVQTA